MSKILPENIKRYRKQLGLTQEQLAEKCNVTASCISRWETGRWSPNAENIFLLSRALGVPIDVLNGSANQSVANVLINQITVELTSLSESEQRYILKMITELKGLHRGD